MPGSLKDFVTQHIEKIQEWVKEKRTLAWAAKKLGISSDSLKKYLDPETREAFRENCKRCRGSHFVRPGELDLAAVQRYADEGHSLNSMAPLFNISDITLRKYLKLQAPEVFDKLYQGRFANNKGA